MKPLIISADDFAQSASIDAGIIALIKQGSLTAASCLSMSPRWKVASTLITPEIRKKADIGLHLDFTQFGSYRYSLPLLMMRSLCRSLSNTKIQLSIHQQMDQFEAQLGTPPDYIDGHQHVHQMPQIREALLQVITTRYGNSSTLPWLRIAKPPRRMGLKGRVIAALGADALARQANSSGISCTTQLLGIYAFDKSADQYLDAVNAWLMDAHNTNGAHALMCHPALIMDTPDEMNVHDPIYHARLHEYAALSRKSFARIIGNNGFTLSRGKAVFDSLQVNQ